MLKYKRPWLYGNENLGDTWMGCDKVGYSNIIKLINYIPLWHKVSHFSSKDTFIRRKGESKNLPFKIRRFGVSPLKHCLQKVFGIPMHSKFDPKFWWTIFGRCLVYKYSWLEFQNVFVIMRVSGKSIILTYLIKQETKMKHKIHCLVKFISHQK